MVLLPSILIMCLLISAYEMVPSTEVVFDHVDFVNATFVKNLYNVSMLRIDKFNRTMYVANTDVEIYVDVDEYFEVAVSFYFNRFNNNQYSKAAMRVRRDKLCTIIDKYYNKFFINDLKGHTNLPTSSGEMKCPIKKVFSNLCIFCFKNVIYSYYRVDIGWKIMHSMVKSCQVFSQKAIGEWNFMFIIKTNSFGWCICISKLFHR